MSPAAVHTASHLAPDLDQLVEDRQLVEDHHAVDLHTIVVANIFRLIFLAILISKSFLLLFVTFNS